MNKSVAKIGFWSALSTTVFALTYVIPQLVIGIEMPKTPLTMILILLPSLFLAPSFLIMMTSVHYYADEADRIWSHIGILFALAYAIFVSIVYFTVLTVTLPHKISGTENTVALLAYTPKSFMTGIDALGYASMSFSTLFTAWIFKKKSGLEKWIRRFFIANGVIAPIILLTQVFPNIAYAGSFWIVSLPTSSMLTMILFSKLKNSSSH